MTPIGGKGLSLTLTKEGGMKFLNLFLVWFVFLWGTTALADPSPWDEFPDECTAEHGVCFQMITEEIWVFGDDPMTGAHVEGTFQGDANDFARQNPNGTYFSHWIAREFTSGVYCPPGWSDLEDCLPIDLSLPSHLTVVGSITILPDPSGFWFSPMCPFTAQASFYVTDAMGDLYKVMGSIITVKSPEGECRFVKYEIKVKPMR